MRVLMLHNRQRGTGGALHVMEEESALLREAGHDVEFLFEPTADESGRSALSMGAAAIWNRQAAAQLTDCIDRFRPHVVHVHTPFPLQSPAVFRVAHNAGCPTVTTVHAYRFSCVGGLCFREGEPCEKCVGSTFKLAGVRHRCYHDSLAGSVALTLSLVGHRMAGTFANHVDRYVALTEFGRDLLVRDGYPAHKITIKPNSAPDPGPPTPLGSRRGYALHVGRLVPEKGIHVLLEAWKEVRGDRHLYVAGDGPLKHLVDEAANRDPRIHSLGWCDASTLSHLRKDASISITPSLWYEGGPPLVVLQSLAAGTPQLLSDLRNISESIVQHGAGMTFRAGDAAGLAARVNEMWDDPSLLEGMSANARALYEAEHTPAQSLRALEDIYEAVLGSNRDDTYSARTARGGG